ncbi:MAG: hypothetical protein DWI10_06620 [Planctomycetota bacterium]|jgi:hypothetical protein|nr:MAG: hypothetical protein DWI10_06620 [Planctomycetota bacterium]
MQHIEQCKLIASAVNDVWMKLGPSNEPLALRFAHLASVLMLQNAGKQGAGLTGGQQQESLFRDMLVSSDSRFVEMSAGGIKDADYYFENYPLSHKTIGFSGSGDLALAWSKNGPTGLMRNEFLASMVIMSFRDPLSSGALKGQPQGAYVIPLDYLRTNIQFTSNNKTDSLISAKQIASAMAYARQSRLFVPLMYRHRAGAGVRVSLWRSGVSPGIPPLD